MIQYKSNFLLLSLSRFVSNLGTSIFNFALSLYVLDITGSATAFSLVISFSILPRIFVNIFAGPFVDQHNKKKIIILTDMASGLVVILSMLLFKSRPTDVLLISLYVIILTLIQSLFNLAINASIPNIVSKENVPKANAVFQGLGAAINILGPVVGALAYKTIGMDAIFLLNGISFIASGAGEMFLRFHKNADDERIAEGENYFGKLKLVFQYLKEQHVIAFFLIVAVIINFVYNPLMLMVVKYITYTIMKVSAFQLSVIQAGWAAGAIIGAVYVSILKNTDKLFKSFFLLLKIQGVLICCWIFPFFINIPDSGKWITTSIYCLILILIGTLNTIQNIPLISYFQVRVPENLRARVFGVFTTSFLISSPLGLYLYGWLLEKVHWALIAGISGIAMLIFSIITSGSIVFRDFIAELGLKKKELRDSYESSI